MKNASRYHDKYCKKSIEFISRAPQHIAKYVVHFVVFCSLRRTGEHTLHGSRARFNLEMNEYGISSEHKNRFIKVRMKLRWWNRARVNDKFFTRPLFFLMAIYIVSIPNVPKVISYERTWFNIFVNDWIILNRCECVIWGTIRHLRNSQKYLHGAHCSLKTCKSMNISSEVKKWQT